MSLCSGEKWREQIISYGLLFATLYIHTAALVYGSSYACVSQNHRLNFIVLLELEYQLMLF